MGTNYYLHREGDCCKHCGRSDPPLHIGKSSAGWCFSLHVDLHNGPHNLDDWKLLFNTGLISNEYDEKLTPTEMLSIITNRSCPDGLLRHKIDNTHCVGYGEGTWDYIIGEFS